jgi:hypothetical protein
LLTRKLKILWLFPLLLVASLLVANQVLNGGSNVARDQPILLPSPPTIDPTSIVSVLDRDSIPAIDDPQFESASKADKVIASDERVIGLIINGDARAYPITILSSHEIVNDIVGGEPVSITWCPLCYSALVFSRQIDSSQEPLSFGVSGKLLHNTIVMYDRQTDSLWSQLYGAAVVGPLAGTTLSFYPSTHTEWKAWLAQYPDSIVLSKELTCAQFTCGSYTVDPYESYYKSAKEGLINNQIPREGGGLESKRLVLGILVNGATRSYLYEVLTTQRLINDEINGAPILVWFEPDSKTAVAFERRVDNRILTFRIDEDNSRFLIDMETNSRWEATTGIAIEGPLRNERLGDLISTTAFEFGWYAYFPDSDNYTP